MKLEKWSWVAGIFAAIVAVLAWLVDRNDFTSFCIATGSVIGTPFLFVYHFLTHPVTWPVWVLIVLPIAVLVIIAGVIYLIVRAVSGPRLPLHISPFHYKTDEIFGVKWVWDFHYQQLAENSLTAFCPRSHCRNRLTMRENYERMRMGGYGGTVPISFTCRNCGFSHPFESNWTELRRDVLEEVERRINTGEFRQSMCQAPPPESGD